MQPAALQCGPPGAGKSTLAHALQSDARLRDGYYYDGCDAFRRGGDLGVVRVVRFDDLPEFRTLRAAAGDASAEACDPDALDAVGLCTLESS
jgi:hypothetical protein